MSDKPARAWDFTAALNAIQSTPRSQWSPTWDDENGSSPPSLSNSVSTDAENFGDTADPSGTSGSLTLGNFEKVFGFLGASASVRVGTPAIASSTGTHDAKSAQSHMQNVSWLTQLRGGHIGRADTNTINSTPQPASWLSQLRGGFVGKRDSSEKASSRNTDGFTETRETKTVMFLDDVFAVPDKGHHSDEPDKSDLSHLSGKARKKERRRLRQLAADDDLQGFEDFRSRDSIGKRFYHATSDADTDAEIKLAIQQSHARRDIINELLTPTRKPPRASNPASPHEFFLRQVSESQGFEASVYSIGSPLAGLRKHGEVSRGSQLDLNETFKKKTELLHLLCDNFPEERLSLSRMKPTPLSAYEEPSKLDATGIHVFVDMSNILIGFHNAIKANRGININARYPRQKLSFYNFSFILERGRPVAKRCLAGSDNLESVEEAVQLGYENNCLDRVLKARRMTPRQQYFAERDRAKRSIVDRSGASSGGEGHTSGFGSGADEAFAPTKKYVEQGVDEILHLKMMQSLVDTDSPGTMVLATGDAAEAEFSDGFLAMCERALKRGWKVELVSFKANMSYEYRRRDWIDRWNGNFRIIFLDEYAEMLRL